MCPMEDTIVRPVKYSRVVYNTLHFISFVRHVSPITCEQPQMADLNQAHYTMNGGINNGNIGPGGTIRRGGSTLHSSPSKLHLSHNYVNNGINDGNDEGVIQRGGINYGTNTGVIGPGGVNYGNNTGRLSHATRYATPAPMTSDEQRVYIPIIVVVVLAFLIALLYVFRKSLGLSRR